ncbi:MAG: ThuA domain-containing protein [Cellulomonadaceae bacterium]|nr:ThuA domain-containing protein [Cellulomonadaceae bacterium]
MRESVDEGLTVERSDAQQRILILAGRGRFDDPWHDTPATSYRVASILGGLDGVTVDVRSAAPDVLDAVEQADLLVLNFSRPRPGFVEAGLDGEGGAGGASWAEEVIAGIASWARRGGSILALHQTILAAECYPELANVLGGHWVEGTSGHPPIGAMTCELDPGHPVAAGLSTVTAFDERYCHLSTSSNIDPVGYVMDDEGNRFSAVWTMAAHGGRTVVSTLGHGPESYDSPSHQALIRNAARWLLA